MANLFTSQTPSVTDASDGTPGITFAVTLVFATDGTVTGVRFYATSTVSGTYTGALWQVTSSDPGTGTLLASKTLGTTPTGGAWNTITFDTPVSVTAGVAYRAGVFSGAGRYVATLSFFGSPLTNGDITAPAHNGTAGGFTISQGVFRIDSTIGYPNSPGAGGANYFADVEFTTGDSTISPTGIEVPVSLGAPTVVASTLAVPTGIEVPVVLGQPTSSFVTPASTPAGVEVPVALGAPAVYHYIAPDGIGVPVTLGAPTIEAPPGPAPVVETGSWFGLLAAVESARSDAELNRERRANPVECFEHLWPLIPTGKGLHCEFGGHVVEPRH